MVATFSSATASTGASSLTPTKLRILALYGGPGDEREISLESGRAVAEGLRQCGHDVRLCDISSEDLSALETPCDVVFPILHGEFGEDGRLQAILEQRGLRFVGSGSRASALAMDKAETKRVAKRLGIRTPAWDVMAPADIDKRECAVGAPAFIKPVDRGSSVGACAVRAPDEIRPAIERVARQFGRALVEQFIAGDELTVGVLAGEPLPPLRIRPQSGFYDYTAKYHDDRTEYLFDTGCAPATLAQVADWSRALYQDIGCRHMARADWLVDADGQAWFLELNTIPGFTSHSLFPKAATRIGLDFAALVDRLARMAMEDRR
ncbi:MAG: D-alanine--D-alanine ligase [Phycisphaerales bacterium]|nr:D-alanine--D-alanine ligase [Phycisphaerales bacterium]